jgi:hypothetical protein
VTVIAGWSGITHSADLVTGRDIESDALLRIRRQASLQVAGSATDGAIRARLLQVEDVLAVVVKSNRTALTDADGIPPHAFETVIWPATVDPTTIATTIYTLMPAGIQPYGTSETAEVTTSQDLTTTVEWTWATELVTHVVVNLTVSADYPVDGDTQVGEAVERAVEGGVDADGVVVVGLSVGDDLVLAKILCECFKVAGILTIEILALVGSTPGGGDNVNLVSTFREIFTVSQANITVNS